MGLSGPRKRRKIAADPNNTNWSSNETGFGRKLLEAQGWTPGTYLGAQGAAHADHFSVASSSHIRVLLKDDTLGLGAKRGSSDAQNFGLGALQDIYGRLNGKSEVVLVKEQAHRADLGRKLYAEQRWGPARFVRGGFLVGEKIEDQKPIVSLEERSLPSASLTASEHRRKGDARVKQAGSKHNLDPQTGDRPDSNGDDSRVGEESDREFHTEGECLKEDEVRESKEDRQRRRMEKRARKAAKRQAKELSRHTPQGFADVTITIGHSKKTVSESEIPPSPSQPMDTGASVIPRKERAIDTRMTVRQRFIKQKRMASMDPQALREILMLKT